MRLDGTDDRGREGVGRLLSPDGGRTAAGARRILAEALLLDVLVLGLVAAGERAEALALLGGSAIVAYLTLVALARPWKGFLLLVGTKLTCDALWFAKFQSGPLSGLGVLEAFTLPLLVLLARGPLDVRRGARWPVVLGGTYLLWTVVATLAGREVLDPRILVRQAGLVLGLLMGLRYVGGASDLRRLFEAVFVSTLVPLAAFLAQVGAGQLGLTILRHTEDTSRGLRMAGLYYDAGTAAMVNVVSMLGAAFLALTEGKAGPPRLRFHLALGAAFVGVVAGGTRSTIGVAVLVACAVVLGSSRSRLATAAVVLGAAFAAQSHVAEVLERSSGDMPALSSMGGILHDDALETRTQLTGRVGLWQDAWDEYGRGSWPERLLGTGAVRNTHSTYFFLLLQVGAGGLALYLGLHVALFATLARSGVARVFRMLAALGLAAVLLVGISLSAVLFTSFQWFLYMVVGAVLGIGAGSVPERPRLLRTLAGDVVEL